MWIIRWAKSLSKSNEFEIPIRNFGKVDGWLYRGALPDRRGYESLRDKLGIQRVVSLIEHQTELDRDLALGSGVKEWVHIPFSDRHAPDPLKVKEWLQVIATAKTGGLIYTHCRGGRHRTGFLVAVYRVLEYGWSKQQAYEEMKRYGWYGALGHRPILEWFLNDFDPESFRR